MKVITQETVDMLHFLRVLSPQLPAEYKNLSSGLRHTALTLSECPIKVATHEPKEVPKPRPDKDHCLILSSEDPEKAKRLSRVTQTDQTLSEWAMFVGATAALGDMSYRRTILSPEPDASNKPSV